MRRVVMSLVVLAGFAAACGPRPVTPLPPVQATTVLPASASAVVGEQMVWTIFWQGLTIGRAELRVDQDATRSVFVTSTLASALASVRHELTSWTSPAGPRAARELLVHDGETSITQLAITGPRFTLDGRGPRDAPGAAPLHTLHTALAAVRAWARPAAAPAFLWLIEDGELYRIDLAPPVGERTDMGRALRIEATVRALAADGANLELSIWLTASPDRTPLRFVVLAGVHRIAAELTETTAALSR